MCRGRRRDPGGKADRASGREQRRPHRRGPAMLTGLLLALAAAACFECSYVLQALEVRALPEIGRPGLGVLRRLVARPRWTLAIVLGLAGFALQVLALRHAPVTLVQPVLAT